MKKIILIAIILFVFFIFSFYLRSDEASNKIKILLLPEIEKTINKKVVVEKFYLNLFPLFVGANDFRVFDEKDNLIFYSKKVRGYMSFLELFNKKLMIKRLSIKEPYISIDQSELYNLTKSLSDIKVVANEKFTLGIKTIHIDSAKITIWDSTKNLTLSGFNSYLVLIDKPEIKISINDLSFLKENFINLRGRLSLHFLLEDDNLEIKFLNFNILPNSDLKTSGLFNIRKFSGEVETELNLLVDSLKNIFGLTNKGEGFISVRGNIKAVDIKSNINNIFLNLKVKGNIYLETLMELLKVHEKLEGQLSFDGTIKGKLNEIVGAGKAKLKEGNLFGVEVDHLTCNIDFYDKKMTFSNAIVSLYSGQATAEAKINLPVVNDYYFFVKADSVSSKKIFELINWDPGLPDGKVSGFITSSGAIFNPTINFTYTNKNSGKDLLNKVEQVSGNIYMKNKIINFTDLSLSTANSHLSVNGTANLQNQTLNLKGKGVTNDIKDLLEPHLKALSGKGEYNVLLTGSFSNPLIDIDFISKDLTLRTSQLGLPEILYDKTFNYNQITTSLSYRKNLLTIKDFQVRSTQQDIKINGNVFFKKSTKLFEIDNPEYDLQIIASDLDSSWISKTFKDIPNIEGGLKVDFIMRGPPNSLKFNGNFLFVNLFHDGIHIAENLNGSFTLWQKQLSFNQTYLKKGNSVITFNGSISSMKDYFLLAQGKNIKLIDFITNITKDDLIRTISNDLYLDNLIIKGRGNLKKPNLELQALLRNNTKNRVGGQINGSINLLLKGQKINANISLMNGGVDIKGSAELTSMMPWALDITLKAGNYTPLLLSLNKEIPEDLALNIVGKIKAFGTKENISTNVLLNKLSLNAFGTTFINKSDIIVEINNRILTIKSFSMYGEDSEFSVSGSIEKDKKLDLTLEGTSSITPVKVFFKDLESLKGKAYFILTVSGDWRKPEINGGIDLINGTIAIKSIPNRLTSVSAYLYIDENKVILKNFSGKLAGGEILVTGTAYIEKMNIKNFYLESNLKSINIAYSKDLSADLDGTLYLRGSIKSQELSGDVYINKAKFTQRVEWKTWLLSAKKSEVTKHDLSRLGQTNLNINVKSNNLIINNNISESRVKVDMVIRGTISNPVLIGNLNTTEGKVFFRNNEFKILKARVDFIDLQKTTPYFDILAETKIKNYTIKLSLDGNFKNFNLSLTSDPHLNENDIFSLLTTGYLGKQMKGLEGGLGTTEATYFLMGKFQDVLEERVKTVIGIDRINIDPQISKTTGTINPRVTLGKKIIGDKLYVTYSASTGVGEEQILKLEYFFDKNISFVGVRDERGSVGGDIKFRFEFR
ncbi:MAG: translocation/assembly module TamB domain-containing protein [Thermodesulfovibrionales bacterium]|nr:translocation/assembly module TamB domain-containing protein [Thermodesulfovibrionales bacterium]